MPGKLLDLSFLGWMVMSAKGLVRGVFFVTEELVASVMGRYDMGESALTTVVFGFVVDTGPLDPG